MKKLLPLLGLTAVALGLCALGATPAQATLFDLFPNGGSGGGAPEIDPSALGSAMALVMGSAAMLSNRFRR